MVLPYAFSFGIATGELGSSANEEDSKLQIAQKFVQNPDNTYNTDNSTRQYSFIYVYPTNNNASLISVRSHNKQDNSCLRQTD